MRRASQVALSSLWFLLSVLISQPSQAKDIGPFYGHERRSVADWIRLMERPGRRSWQKPELVVRYLNIIQGQTIADIGAGSGYFTVPFSKAVGSSGEVFAVDIEPGYLDYIKQRIKTEKLDNVVLHLAQADDPKLEISSQDMVFFCNTWHYVEKRGQYLKRLHQILKPGGSLAIIDFRLERIPFGPPYERRIPKSQLITEAQAEGFKLLAEYYFLPYQYFVIFKKATKK